MAAIKSGTCAHVKHIESIPTADKALSRLACPRLSFSDCGSSFHKSTRIIQRGCTITKAHIDDTDRFHEFDLNAGQSFRSALCRVTASAAAAALCFHGFIGSPAVAQSLTIVFPASKIHEVTEAQRTLVETWGLVRETYVDPTFNHQDWDSKLEETMKQILPVKTADAAYGKIQNMLATLGDPFTRLVSPKEYQSFKITNDGVLQGVGLLIASDRETGKLVVISSLEGGPADRAGIHSGDELVQIDDEVLIGMDGDKAASKLRGPAGTPVKLKIRSEGATIEQGEADMREIVSLVEAEIYSHFTSNYLSNIVLSFGEWLLVFYAFRCSCNDTTPMLRFSYPLVEIRMRLCTMSSRIANILMDSGLTFSSISLHVLVVIFLLPCRGIIMWTS